MTLVKGLASEKTCTQSGGSSLSNLQAVGANDQGGFQTVKDGRNKTVKFISLSSIKQPLRIP